MIWYDSLFLGTGCQSKQKTLRRRISKCRPHPGVYLITLPTQEHECLEIIPSALLLQPEYPGEDLRIIGMALTHDEAVELVERIIQETYAAREDLDVEAFMQNYGKNREMKMT